MDDMKPVISYFRRKTEARQQQPTREEWIEIIASDPIMGPALDENKRMRLIRHIEHTIGVRQPHGAIVTDNQTYESWLPRRKPDVDFYYWNRLKDYLIDQDILPPNVISTLDSDTDDVLDRSGNPESEKPHWDYRGMVIGNVQSGKTTNYSALITKAADTGYKVIILMAGITNSLRSQTQQRLDEYFIGRRSVLNAQARSPLKIRSFGGLPIKEPVFGTTIEQDFNRPTAEAISGLAFSSLKEPIIFIIKKNKSVLENLNTWINDQAHGQTLDYPVLMIDDEADNASINTSKNPGRTTAINTQIRVLLDKFTRSTYVGYTATPFANIFIEPESQDDLEEEDLFPKHFIKALSPPTNYCGASRIFNPKGDLHKSTVRIVDDYVNILRLKHKKDDPLDILPPSLKEAIRVFVLARTIRHLRGDGKKHCTMMINVSRFNDMQSRVEDLVYIYLEDLKTAMRLYAKSKDPLSNSHLSQLKKTFETEYAAGNVNFTEILDNLHEAAITISVRTVNMRGGKLDYERQSENGLHMIAIGGLALSRGLTLEGLVTTYLLRNVGASDTLMQMARWFGYRTGYEDLCRIYLPLSAANHYKHISVAIEELRAVVQSMPESQTPLDFGLKVRQSPTGIRITAANKMRSATELKLAADYAGRYVQGHAIYNDQKKNLEHIKLVKEFLGTHCSVAEVNTRPPYWTGINVGAIIKLLEYFTFPAEVLPLTPIRGRDSLLGEYIKDRMFGELASWDVAVTTRLKPKNGETPIQSFLEGYDIYPPQRTAADVKGSTYRFTGSSNAVGDQTNVQMGLSEEQKDKADILRKEKVRGRNSYCRVRKKPLLIIYTVSIPSGKDGVNLKDFAVSLGFCMPETNKEFREQTYQVNSVFRNSTNGYFNDEIEEDADKLNEDG